MSRVRKIRDYNENDDVDYNRDDDDEVQMAF